MAEVNKEDIKLFSSQRLDDTSQGGGAMTLTEIVDGAVNNLFPDISRLDRVYGRVSLRKAFMSVQTAARPTYYGSHVVITQQASDPRVGVSFFTTENWFDVRTEAQSRVESYLAKGSIFGMSVYGHHFLGSRALKCYTGITVTPPEIGDVLVLTTSLNLNGQSITEVNQFVRVIDVSSSIQNFTVNDAPVQKKVIDMTLGNTLTSDFPGMDITTLTSYTTNATKVYTTVVADSAKYYGILPLAEPATTGSLSVRATDIKIPLVPSAQSETAIVDASIGAITNPMVQPKTTSATVTRTISGSKSPGVKVYIGEGIIPGSLVVASLSLTDNSKGDLLTSGEIIGSIDYPTGVITWGDTASGGAFTASFVYIPACSPVSYSESQGLYVDTNNRGFVYTFFCDPIPAVGTLKVDFLSGGKWYSIWDHGGGEIKGSDTALGTGTLNYVTGSVSLSLGALPDAESMILFFWSVATKYYDLSGDTSNFSYEFDTPDKGIAAGTFILSWTQDAIDYSVQDDGGSNLDFYTGVTLTLANVGIIDYTDGKVIIDSLPITPPYSQTFDMNYNQGNPVVETFVNPVTVGNTVTISLNNTSAIIPRTLKVSWTGRTYVFDGDSYELVVFNETLKGYEQTWRGDDLVYGLNVPISFSYKDDGSGLLDEPANSLPQWIQGTVDYTGGAGELTFSPFRHLSMFWRSWTKTVGNVGE